MRSTRNHRVPAAAIGVLAFVACGGPSATDAGSDRAMPSDVVADATDVALEPTDAGDGSALDAPADAPPLDAPADALPSPDAATADAPGPDAARPPCTATLPAGGDLVAFATGLHAGDVGCLASGATYDLAATHAELDFRSATHGTMAAPITLTSADPARPATIRGRIVFFPGADWITLAYLALDGINASNAPSPTIGSDHVTLSHDDITNEHTAICVNVIDDATYGTAHGTVIDSNRVHDCGALPPTNEDHGLYIIGVGTVVTNNVIWGNADRGVQLRGSHGARVQYNVIDGNGEGVIFGDLGASDNEVSYNVISNSVVRFNAESYWGSGAVGTGNSLHHNCVWTTRTGYYATAGGVMPGITGVDAHDNLVADPMFTDAAAHDYSLRPGSPCAAMAPR